MNVSRHKEGFTEFVDFFFFSELNMLLQKQEITPSYDITEWIAAIHESCIPNLCTMHTKAASNNWSLEALLDFLRCWCFMINTSKRVSIWSNFARHAMGRWNNTITMRCIVLNFWNLKFIEINFTVHKIFNTYTDRYQYRYILSACFHLDYKNSNIELMLWQYIEINI